MLLLVRISDRFLGIRDKSYRGLPDLAEGNDLAATIPVVERINQADVMSISVGDSDDFC